MTYTTTAATAAEISVFAARPRHRRGLHSRSHSLFRGGFRRCAGDGNLRCLPELSRCSAVIRVRAPTLRWPSRRCLSSMETLTPSSVAAARTEYTERDPAPSSRTSGVTAAACARAWASCAISRCNRSSSLSRCSRCASKRPISVWEPAKEPGRYPVACQWVSMASKVARRGACDHVAASDLLAWKESSTEECRVRGPAPVCL